MSRISELRWQEAQAAERRFHNEPKEVSIPKYKDSYRQYFEWLGIEQDLKGKSIIEIGCAHIPALYFCENYSPSIIVEPMPSSILRELVCEMNEREGLSPPDIYLANDVVEMLSNDLMKGRSEVWLFNVLQHVLDPDKVIENCKAWAKTIRFFEPVDQPISDCHPHAPTQADFKRWFGDVAKLYEGNPNAVNFHTANCMYGTWTS